MALYPRYSRIETRLVGLNTRLAIKEEAFARNSSKGGKGSNFIEGPLDTVSSTRI